MYLWIDICTPLALKLPTSIIWCRGDTGIHANYKILFLWNPKLATISVSHLHLNAVKVGNAIPFLFLIPVFQDLAVLFSSKPVAYNVDIK